jgi:hypothetical protein
MKSRKIFLFFYEILGLVLFFSLAITGTAKAGTLSCSVASSCAGGVVIYRMSGSTNAHAEMPGQSNVNYNANQVCCTGVTGLSNSCSGTYATALKLFGVTNSHVQQYQVNTYTNNACISVPSGGSVSVGYQATNCSGYDTTLGSMSATNNSHVGNAAAYPSIQICASASGTPDPSITTMLTCPTGGDRDSVCGTTASPEYTNGNTDGLIYLVGTNFGSTAGTIQFNGGFGGPISGTIHNVAEGACAASGWTNNSVCVEVNSAIANNVYDGTVTLIRNGDSKQSTIGLHIQPRITSNTPATGAPGDTVQIDGDHFCQPSGTCPNQSLLPDTDHIAYFGSTQALSTDFVTTCSNGTKWSDTQVCVKIPVGTPSGSQNTKIQGKLLTLYESQRQSFTSQSVTPATPNNLKQSRNSGFTNLIPTGGYASSTPVYFAFDTSVPTGGGTLYPQLEIRPVLGVNSNFVSTCAAGTFCEEGSGSAYTSGTATLNISTSSPDNLYHWQIRARYRKNGIDYYSAWKSYPDGGNPETSADLIINTTGPIITFSPVDSCAGGQTALGANGVTINWNMDESGTGQLQYSKNPDLSSSVNFPVIPQAAALSQSITLSNLDSGTTYYYRVKSTDAPHNLAQRPVSSPYCSFITSSINTPAKTTSFYIMGATSGISSLSTTSFSVIAPETSPTVQNAFIEVSGLVSGGSNPITVQANGVSSRSYSVSAANPTLYKFVYQVSSPNQEANLNLNDAQPCTNGEGGNKPCNMFSITPGAGMTVYIYSARLIMTYSYTQ